MPKKPKTPTRISPIQALLALAFMVIIAVIQYLSQGAAPNQDLPPTITPAVSIPPTDTPLAPGGPPTLTPVDVDLPPLDSLGEFDYFLRALSWSPDYCATNGNDDPQQCSVGRKLGFVLHGLWPQYERGYPSSCTTEKMSADVKAQFPGLYPNDDLFDHEWEKHGTCTGLSPTVYLTLSRELKESVTIPSTFISPEKPFRTTVEKLKQEFAGMNPDYSAASFAVNCSSNGRYLKELYVCFSKDGQPTSCRSDVQRSAQKTCQNPDFLVRNIR